MFDDLITSKTRIKILHLFLGNISEMFHVREIVRRVDEEINAVRRELMLLDKKGILIREARANRVLRTVVCRFGANVPRCRGESSRHKR